MPTTIRHTDARMAHMNLLLALAKLRALRDELEEARDDLDALSQSKIAIVKVSAALQEVERL